MSSFCKPCAKTIIDIKEDNKLILNLETLRELLTHDDIKDKDVCIISIAGAFRQGKSFLLNFLIRYLNIRYKEKRNVTNWLNQNDEPITGFSWRGGSERDTIGILMWSEIFLVKLPTGNEIAIILLDTQGTFDNETTLKNCAGIFALSTLISSVQMYNLKDNIKSSDLSHLQFFSGYGQLLKKNATDSDEKFPFQHLFFLIRDWSNPEEKEFGMNGGQKLLDKILSTDNKNLPEEIISLRRDIKNLFKEINCFLLPHPGLEATNARFQGNLNVIDDKFKKYVEILAPAILAPENLVPKSVNGMNIKAKHLFRFIENYCEQFQYGNIPPTESLFKATANAQHAAALEESEAIYDESMKFLKHEASDVLTDDLLLEIHNENRSKAVYHFTKKKLMGNEEMKLSNKEKLKKKLDTKFTEYENLNKIKYQKEKQIELEQSMNAQKTKISHLEDEIENEKQRREDLIEQQQQFASEQQSKIEQLEKKLEDENERQAEVQQLLKDQLKEYVVQDDDSPEAVIGKGFTAVGHGVGKIVVGSYRVAKDYFFEKIFNNN